MNVVSVLGKLSYEELTNSAKSDLSTVVDAIVIANEDRYISYFNEAQAVTPRLHALEIIPGIGKTFMMQIIKERDKKLFENFEDLQQRVGLKDAAKLISKRIVEEVSGGARINLFVRK